MTTTYKAGANVVEAQLHTYYVKIDPVTQIAQLMHYDGSANAGVPVRAACLTGQGRLLEVQ